jgi:hypothetical protein
MNATHMMVSQAGMSLAGLLWGVLATALDFKWALFSASALGIASALTARRLSIDFSAEIDQEAHPLEQEERPLYLPESDDGPITITLEIEVAPENHIQFFRLVKEVRLVFPAQRSIQRPVGSGHGKPKSISFAGNTSLVGRAPATGSTNHAR